MTDTPRPRWTLNRSRRTLGAGLVVLMGVVPLAAAACSNGDTVEADGPTSSITATTLDPNAVTTIPDMGNVVGPVGSCLGAAAKFTNLVQGVLEGGEGAKRSQQAAEQLKAELPADLDDDADVVAAKFGDIAARGGALTDADVNDPAYNAASAALSAYFAQNCQG